MRLSVRARVYGQNWFIIIEQNRHTSFSSQHTLQVFDSPSLLVNSFFFLFSRKKMYYHHLSNLIVLFLILPSLVELTAIQTDVLILPNLARTGFVLLEETKPSRYQEFDQCLKDNEQLNLHIDEKYGDLILNQTIEYFDRQQQQQRLLCTINRNQVKINK